MKSTITLLVALACYLTSYAQLITSTGTMITGRTFFQSQILSNGKVLIMGGDDGSGTTTFKSAELYDPKAGTWSSTGSMLKARTGFGSILLDNGNVMVIGGNTDASSFIPTASCEIYDVSSGTWSFTDSLKRPDGYSQAVRLNTGKILEISASIGLTHLYDQSSKKWTLTDTAKDVIGGNWCSLMLLASGKAFLCGSNTDRAELYNPATNKWTTVTNHLLTSVYYSATSIQLKNGKVLINIPNTNDELFDTSKLTFDSVPQTANPHNGCKMVLLSNGNALISGIGNLFNFTNTQNLEVFSPVANKWYIAGTVKGTIMGVHYAMWKLSTGKILVGGGDFGGTAIGYCYLVDEKYAAAGTHDMILAENNFTLWPNPTHRDFMLQLNNKNHNLILITITDVVGKTIYTHSTQADNLWHFSDNNNNVKLAAGTYIVSVISGNNTTTQKLIIE